MSRAALPTAPAATPSAPASSPIRLRWCATGGRARPGRSSRASAATIASGSPPTPSSVPAGPPSWTRRRTLCRWSAASSRLEHPARGLQPERRRLGLLEQRAADDRRRRGGPRPASPRRPPRARRSPSSGTSARLATSIAAVSTASWLVAPWCTGASVELPQAFDDRPRRVADLRRLRRRSPRGRSSRVAAASTIGPASSITPAPACACASATSKSSSACSHARPETRSATPPRASTPAKTSEPEEDGLTLALEMDVEAEPSSPGPGSASRGAPRGTVASTGSAGSSVEVDPRDDAVEHPAGEHADVDVRRLPVADRAGLDGEDLPRRRRRSSAQRPKPRKPVPKRPSGSACQVSISASGTGSPAPSSTWPWIRNRPGVPSGTTSGAVRPRQADRQVGPDGLRRRRHACGSSIGVASSPRRTMSQR